VSIGLQTNDNRVRLVMIHSVRGARKKGTKKKGGGLCGQGVCNTVQCEEGVQEKGLHVVSEVYISTLRWVSKNSNVLFHSMFSVPAKLPRNLTNPEILSEPFLASSLRLIIIG
jgi:hypothetical protein